MTITLQDLDLPPRGDTRDSSDAHTHTTAMSARESHRAAGHPRVYSSAVEHRIADPAVTGSNPVVPFCAAHTLRCDGLALSQPVLAACRYLTALGA